MTFITDLKCALRSLARVKGLAITEVVTLALAGVGVAAGAAGGVVLARIVGSYIQDVRIPGVLPVLGAATILVAAAILASLMPAARAARVDVIRALRSD